MGQEIRCFDCLNYVSGYDDKKMCKMDGKMTKVKDPIIVQCKGKGYKAKINLNSVICKKCDYHTNEANINWCTAVLDIVTGDPKKCSDARNNECGKTGVYFYEPV